MDLSKKHNIHFAGNPQAGKTLVFGHGFGIDQQSFSQIVPAFEQDYRIVLYDNAGGGKSDLSSYNYERYETLEGYVTDLTGIMAFTRGTHTTFIGHSVSGMMAANDIVVPPVVSEYMERHIPGSKRIKINAQGHFPQISAPDEVIAALQSFV
ncbi:alpha/beta hydrolase [Chitinophaga sp. G-6-1-13]|uniref:Alpha/beta hydrolase n=1 Tax=Chitinophaga fulva TaxID=2728842 RepID=A0A848GMQ5_9BACT|nr:alpha/beta hydrolase [Chitinophaga fulva]NML38242.1 alpha/beta hydrolase [Chitinophaga fulva]